MVHTRAAEALNLPWLMKLFPEKVTQLLQQVCQRPNPSFWGSQTKGTQGGWKDS